MTRKFVTSACALGLAALALTTPALADEGGKDEYMTYCASCHGTDAIGNGPMAEFMTVRVPDLTILAQANDGVFPFLDVMHSIDGRSGVMSHGSEMPVWGDRFTADSTTGMVGEYSAIFAARGRVVSLVYYLESIQK